MTSTPTGAEPIALVAELWYAESPDLSDPELLAALRALSVFPDGFTTDANGYFTMGNTAVPGRDLFASGAAMSA